MRTRSLRKARTDRAAALGAALLLSLGCAARAQETTTSFGGGAVPSGSVRHTLDGGRHVLTLSDDFSIHDEPPDPHWRVIDSAGNIYQLDKLKIHDDKINKSIVLPGYITDVAKVQMWCAFVEAVLGEVAFAKPVRLK